MVLTNVLYRRILVLQSTNESVNHQMVYEQSGGTNVNEPIGGEHDVRKGEADR